jgi:SAM-dependent methyltransferase
MSEDFKQTWWDKYLATRFNDFESWVGDSTATSKAFFRSYVIGMEFKSLLDVGCGNATEYFAYQKEYPGLYYLGVDSSEFLFNRNGLLGIPMMKASGEDIPLPDNSFDVVFSRHVLEHQPSFKPVLSEMIRIARDEAIHVFFIIPKDTEIIDYNQEENLYHNTFSKPDIEAYLKENESVESFIWTPIIEGETGLIIKKKAQL